MSSKEMSDWRKNKESELLRRVVLPNIENQHWLKKTHKGEIEMNIFARDDPIEDFPLAETSSMLSMPKETKMTKAECVDFTWRGILKLSVSPKVKVHALFQSGQRLSANHWDSTINVKGRVHHDDFELFVQGLKMSKSRSLMVVKFVAVDVSAETRGSLHFESIHYVTKEICGYAEPASNVKLYLLPPSARTCCLLKKITLQEDLIIDESIVRDESSLLGLVVSRGAPIDKRDVSTSV